MTEPDSSPPARFAGPADVALAYRHCRGDRGPTVVFLPGYKSDMSGGKASALFAWAEATGHAALLFDYSGCGESDGDFANGTLTRWRDEAIALIDHVAAGPIVLCGSSMGGWLMLLIGEALVARDGADKLAGLIGIAAAPDFTDWGLSDAMREALSEGKTVHEDNPYGPEQTPFHPGFFADATDNQMLGRKIALTCPVRLIHGQRDDDVPWKISLRLADALESNDIRVTLIKDGDHRLSRESDIALLLATTSAMVST